MLLATCSLITAIAAVQDTDVPVEGEIPFLRSMNEAREVAIDSGRPIFAYFTFHG